MRCRQGFSDIQKVMKQVRDRRFRVYIVWMPILQSDDLKTAQEQCSEFSDSRVVYYWDANRITGPLWQLVMKIPAFAWDIYLLYDKEAHWSKQPTVPIFWMHQLRGALDAPLLNVPELTAKTKQLLAK